MNEPAVAAIAWYRREDWDRWQSILKDSPAGATWEGWHERAVEVAKKLESDGHRVARVTMDVDTLLAWCRDNRRNVDRQAVTELATLLVRTGH